MLNFARLIVKSHKKNKNWNKNMTEVNQKDLYDIEEEENGSGFSFKEIWNIIMLRWPWIILSVVLCLGGAYFYLKHQVPTYSSVARMYIKDDSGSGKRRASNAMSLQEMGIISSTDGFENELEILKSTRISNAVIKELSLNITYFVPGRFVDVELYKCSPVVAMMDKEVMDSLPTSINLELTPNTVGCHLVATIGNPDKNGQRKEIDINAFPASFETSVGTIKLARDTRFDFDKTLTVKIVPTKVMGRAYANKLSAQASNKTTTVAVLGLVDTQPERAVDYLTQLMISYNNDANEHKNEVATKTKEFLDDRIRIIEEDLKFTETQLEDFKQNNKLINLANDATNALSNTTSYQKEQIEILTQISLVKSLTDYVNNPANATQVIPAVSGINDALVNAQISRYNEALIQYNRLTKTGAENNPAIIKLGEEVNDLHTAVAQSLRKISSDLQIQKRSIDGQYDMYSRKIANTPTHERTLTEIGRQQEIKSGLYLTLLQKRLENDVTLNSAATKAYWLDEPQAGGQVSPKKKIIWALAFLLGLILPIGIFFLRELLRYRIEGRDDVEKLTKVPIMADIPFAHLPKGEERCVVVAENTNDTMEESFRGLRTNMRFIMDSNQKVILCTSTIPGEGKTFVCTNLAMSYALLGKKVIVIGLDIRKPQLVRLFKLPADKRGITNFLADNEAGFDVLEQQIHHGVINDNLDVMPAGIIPPNPGELISRSRLDDAINYLRDKYDIIMLDTPPVGLVSDTLELGRVADVSIYVCRADYSPKGNFELLNSLKEENKLPKISLVLNGVDLKKKKYGYQYGYGKYGKYGKYGRYGHYGHYGTYGNYDNTERKKNGKDHIEN